MFHRLFAAALTLSLAACGNSEPGGGAVDSSLGGGFDAVAGDALVADAPAVLRPTWRLEDVQPQSPRFGQTYGVDVYTDHTVVVTLVEGF
jgi:hypothetical protein